MTFTIEFSWWAIPTIVTVIALALALFWPSKSNGYLDGIDNIFYLIPALFVSCIAWIIAAVMK